MRQQITWQPASTLHHFLSVVTAWQLCCHKAVTSNLWKLTNFRPIRVDQCFVFSFVVQVLAGRNLEWADVSKMSGLLQVHATVDLRPRQSWRSCRHTTQTAHPWSYTGTDNMTSAYTEHMHSISPPRLLNGKCKPTHNKHTSTTATLYWYMQ